MFAKKRIYYCTLFGINETTLGLNLGYRESNLQQLVLT